MIHHYKAIDKGIATEVNIIVATVNNTGPMSLSIKNAAKGFIKDGHIDQGILNICEMDFLAYDPCMSCASHSITGKMPLAINILDNERNLIKKLSQ